MKQLRTLATTALVLGVIIMGVSNARAGMLMSDFVGGDSAPCTETKGGSDTKVDSGIIVTGLTVILGEGVTKAIFGTPDEQTNCGIIVTG